jgi:DNA-binding NarL/FixJ family response regulator
MKKWICILINKLTFNKVCLNWCEVKTPITKNETEVNEVVKPAAKKKVKPAAKKKVKPAAKKKVKPAAKKKVKPATKKKVKITPQMKKSFVKDRKNGLSFKAIGEKHGIPTSTITYHVKNSK